MATTHVSSGDFKKEVLEQKGVVMVDFYADWCGPCKMTAPLIEELSEDPKYKDVLFVKIDVDQNQELAAQYSVFSIPTFITFFKGEVINQFAGARDKTGFQEALEMGLAALKA